MPYWLVALPLTKKRREATWELLQEKASGLGSNYKLEIPELRVGTLDTLMALSDELSKTSNVMEAVVGKIRRQITDFGGAGAAAGLRIDNLSTDQYVQRFKWDEAKFPVRRPLKETVEKVTEVVGRIEDDLKVKLSEYNNLKSQLSAVTRKAAGSIAVRDVSTMVKAQQMVDTENLTSMFVVVSKFALREWEQSYETLAKFVVPRSSTVVQQDNDYALVSVVLFRRVIDDFRAAARSKGYQVREYVAPAEGVELSAAAAEQLKRDVESRRASLEQWCKTAYGEVFSSWMHISAVRIFVESILRYGLPPAFQAAVIQPQAKQEAKLRAALAASFADGKAQYWKDDGSSSLGLVDSSDLHPYVSFTLHTEGSAN